MANLLSFFILFISLVTSANAYDFNRDWEVYKKNYLTDKGYIVDSFSHKSHSEGQGISLVLAARANDQKAFLNILQATLKHQKPNNLFKWSFEGDVALDSNNATDGDLYIAWGLAEGAKAFSDSSLKTRANSVFNAIATLMIKDETHGPVLLPGEFGFNDGGVTTINLSYWVYPAISSAYSTTKDIVWKHLYTNGIKISEYAYFGVYKLPSDWISLTDPVKPSKVRPAQFGYDAVRIPLFLKLAKIDSEVISRFNAFAKSENFGVYSLDKESANKEGSPTFNLVKQYCSNQPLSHSIGSDYFSDSLYLLLISNSKKK